VRHQANARPVMSTSRVRENSALFSKGFDREVFQKAHGYVPMYGQVEQHKKASCFKCAQTRHELTKPKSVE
jgi:hypothetical protein